MYSFLYFKFLCLFVVGLCWTLYCLCIEGLLLNIMYLQTLSQLLNDMKL